MILTKRNGIFVSDRQQTMADGKTYGGIQKIFEISQIHSSAMLINGKVDFEDVPIETLISEFKFKTDFGQIGTIEEIKDKFIKFLSENTESSSVDKYIEPLLKSFKQDLILEITQTGFDNVLLEKQRKVIFPFFKKYSNYHDEFSDIIPNDKDNGEYTKILWEIFSFELQFEAVGIVLAGFNLKSHYQSFFEIEIYFNDNGRIIYEVVDSAIDSKRPIVKVFAINEEAYTFITGVNDEFIDFILNYISDANESIIDNVKWNLEKENVENVNFIIEFIEKAQNKEYSKIINHIDNFRLDALEYTTYSIENLPEWLLCLFADLLIRLTAVKQKTSSEIESVSIESDILIIQKYQGFKWIKNYGEIV
jgi:hypothetical protein